MPFLVIDDPPLVRVEIGAGSWVTLSPEEARHMAASLSRSADRVEKEKPDGR